MKKFISLTLVLIIVLSTLVVTASAATTIPNTLTRNIQLKGRNADGSFPTNPVIPGESTTTGLPTTNTAYFPILVQIDNNPAGLPQWGIASADIMYELPIAGQGMTRLTAFFSDQYPIEAGPVRSGRVMHVDLREEWDALILHYGKQEDAGSDMREALRDYGVNAKGLAIDGIAQKYENDFPRVKYHKAPHNVSAYVQKLHDDKVAEQYPFKERPFKFTDDTNYGGTPVNEFTVIHKGNKDFSSTYVYDQNRKAFLRYTLDGPYYDLLKPEIMLAYNNVIIQRSKLSWNGSSSAPLFNDIVGTGAADIFVAGQYIAGAWARNKLNERTVFFDQNGNELALQRGKTWIVICDDSTDIILGDIDTSGFQFVPDGEQEDAASIAGQKEPATTNNQLVVTQQPAEGNKQQSTATNPATTTQTGETGSTNAGDVATVKLDNNGLLNMRKSDARGADIVVRIPNGTVVQVLNRETEWTQVRYDGKEGYVMSSFLQFAEPASESEEAAETEGSESADVPATKEYTTLKVGDSGDEVLELKKRFAELGYFRTDKFNDRFVESTAEAVRRFERRNKLAVDGIADPEMQAVLFSDVAVGP